MDDLNGLARIGRGSGRLGLGGVGGAAHRRRRERPLRGELDRLRRQVRPTSSADTKAAGQPTALTLRGPSAFRILHHSSSQAASAFSSPAWCSAQVRRSGPYDERLLVVGGRHPLRRGTGHAGRRAGPLRERHRGVAHGRRLALRGRQRGARTLAPAGCDVPTRAPVRRARGISHSGGAGWAPPVERTWRRGDHRTWCRRPSCAATPLELRSLSATRATFSVEPAGYEERPAHVAVF